MSSAYGKIPKPSSAVNIDSILPIKKTLRDNTVATLQRIDSSNIPLVQYLHELFNGEIESGSTYPQEETLSFTQFKDYFLSYDAFVLTKELIENDKVYNYADQVIGMYYVKPNYPGRASHICNGGFFTSPIHRGLGAGVALGETYLIIAPALGYKASMFNLVFVNNEASIRIWRRLGFQEVGRVPKAARLNNCPGELVDALMFYYDFTAEKKSSK
ncbi:hypothetical protein J3Q64DRAFT_1722133 [Phycomyces blakesleeanus]|uniref:N-acetyltransferase domain-containing protein n=2 Tax=Phycomyces blakesleeanus TaxID=4837 RepID=A0A167NV38_PHYB8|nr:hypothetical protein PHYBLDRAFT_180187 [Phycomyces blakesleeanus NRRL 1555(-)]OAD76678.1 hypothetical protein PHYBLDRAFT_180187 [Phycomyces blakesleeanus NRRL 1555(-)]|eukprot:XP_018294718.1 hypothetical protein PHYBLDRAFT_180187 [Phycomyces blakesleeanus NRRL 1555(-)]